MITFLYTIVRRRLADGKYRANGGYRVHGQFYPGQTAEELANDLGIAEYQIVNDVDADAKEAKRVRREQNRGRVLPGADERHFGMDDDSKK
jgi:hypothetical protein